MPSEGQTVEGPRKPMTDVRGARRLYFQTRGGQRGLFSAPPGGWTEEADHSAEPLAADSGLRDPGLRNLELRDLELRNLELRDLEMWDLELSVREQQVAAEKRGEYPAL